MISSSTDGTPRTEGLASERDALRLAGGLLLGGFVLNALVTSLFHPSGSEDDHRAIFADYAESDAWVAIHLGQFVAVLIALAGLLALYIALRARGGVTILAPLAAGATVMTAAVWAVLQAVDGVALKQTVDAWVDSSGSQEALRYGDAETLRWTEWGIQRYFPAVARTEPCPVRCWLSSSSPSGSPSQGAVPLPEGRRFPAPGRD